MTDYGNRFTGSRAPAAVLIAGATLLFAPAQADDSARECRARVGPLLLQQDPDREALRVAEAACLLAANSGSHDATYRLAFFRLGLLDWQPEAAIELISTAAQGGVAEARYWLAWQYESGPLLPNAPGLALSWYLAAADLEHKLALVRLADAYRNGELGLAPDARKAAMLRARAERCENSSI